MKSIHPFLDPGTARRLDPKIALSLGALPLRRQPNGSFLAALSPKSNPEARDNLEACLRAPIEIISVPLPDIHRMINFVHGLGGGFFSSLNEDTLEEKESSPENREAAMIRFVDNVLKEAARREATDIHFEPGEASIKVRFRVDGILKEIPSTKALFSRRFQLASRVKILGGMNIAERRLPQDGRFRFKEEEKDFDVRVSSVPGLHGETLTLRLLPKEKRIPTFEALGFSSSDQEILVRALSRPHGLILATGPTGHGKTTTLYTCLSKLLSEERKIVTIEDPVEVRMEGATQIQTRPEIGLSFNKGLRALLRQDPDVVMIGEIRDEETAQIAVRAALTGHLVLSTLHANDAVSAAARLLDMGVPAYLLGPSLSLVLAQRLVRLKCPLCGGKDSFSCPHCEGAGLKGRTGLFEVLSVTEEVQQAWTRQNPKNLIMAAAKKSGFIPLGERGVKMAQEEKTTLSEIERVLGTGDPCF